jgi:hypothetical protein
MFAVLMIALLNMLLHLFYYSNTLRYFLIRFMFSYRSWWLLSLFFISSIVLVVRVLNLLFQGFLSDIVI